MLLLPKLTALLGLILTSSSVFAWETQFPGLPFSVKDINFRIDKHQFAYTTIDMGANGKGRVVTRFSNGKQGTETCSSPIHSSLTSKAKLSLSCVW